MADTPNKQVLMQKIYLKDASVEIPNAPQIFTKSWKPQVDVNLATQTQALKDDMHQVVLSVTVTTKIDEDVAFLIEIHQAGIFQIQGFSDEVELRAVLGAYCPNILFPFAREAVADLGQKAGFPQLLLQPVNFDAMYQEHVARSAGKPAGDKAH